MAEIYVPTEAYRAAVNAIAAMTGHDADEIKIALGEAGNIWPANIQADVARHGLPWNAMAKISQRILF
jgi:hypothetical protein